MVKTHMLIQAHLKIEYVKLREVSFYPILYYFIVKIL